MKLLMNRLAFRIAALLLIPCLVTDPVMASTFNSPLISHTAAPGLFQRQALSPTELVFPRMPILLRRLRVTTLSLMALVLFLSSCVNSGGLSTTGTPPGISTPPGSGTPGPPLDFPHSLKFPDTPLDGTSKLPLVLSNPGDTPVTVSYVRVGDLTSGANFSDINVPPSFIVPTQGNGNVNISVTFSPTIAAPGGSDGYLSMKMQDGTSAPITYQVTLSGTGRHWAKLSWSPMASTVVGFNIYRGAMSGGPYQRLNPSPISGDSYLDIDVEPGHTYFYRVTSVNKDGVESNYSDEAVGGIPMAMITYTQLILRVLGKMLKKDLVWKPWTGRSA
jgi:hypothetical protein